MVVPRASANVDEYTHHFSLGNGTVTIGMVAVDSRLRPSIQGIQRMPYPKNTTKIGSGSGEISDFRPPYGEFSRTNWSNGLGMLHDDDATRYWFGKRAWTASSGKVLLNPRMYKATTPYPNFIGAMEKPTEPMDWITYNFTPDGVLQLKLSYVKFQITGNGDSCKGIRLLLRTLSTTTAIKAKVTLHEDDGGSIGAVVRTGYILESMIGENWYTVTWDSYTLTNATAFWVKITNEDSTNVFFDVGAVRGESIANYSGLFNLNKNIPAHQMILSSYATDWIPFEYKWAQYAICTTNKKIYINGDRGYADDNTSDKTKLFDASKSWDINEHVGAVVVIYSGPGTAETRKVISNGATYLVVDRDWTTTHTTSTCYLLQGSPSWTDTGVTLAQTPKDAAVMNESVVVIAEGADNQLQYYRFNTSGAHELRTGGAGGDPKGADFVLAHVDETGAVLWRADNSAYSTVSKAPATAWGTDLTFETEIKVGLTQQDITGLIYFDSKLAVMRMDGVWFVSEGKAEKTSLHIETQWDYYNGRRPTVFTPYLVFGLQNSIQRMYSSLTESFGPEKDDGLDPLYNGLPYDFSSIIGGILVAKNCGSFVDTGENEHNVSGVYLYRSGGWHPIAHMAPGVAIYGIAVQRRHDQTDVLHIFADDGVYYMIFPRQWDWRRDKGFTDVSRPASDGWVMSSWFSYNDLVNNKYFKSISVVGDMLHESVRGIDVWYQLDEGQYSVTGGSSGANRWREKLTIPFSQVAFDRVNPKGEQFETGMPIDFTNHPISSTDPTTSQTVRTTDSQHTTIISKDLKELLGLDDYPEILDVDQFQQSIFGWQIPSSGWDGTDDAIGKDYVNAYPWWVFEDANGTLHQMVMYHGDTGEQEANCQSEHELLYLNSPTIWKPFTDKLAYYTNGTTYATAEMQNGWKVVRAGLMFKNYYYDTGTTDWTTFIEKIVLEGIRYYGPDYEGDYDYDKPSEDVANWNYAGQTGSAFNNTINLNAEGRRVRFLFRLWTTDDLSPCLLGYSVNLIARGKAANSYNATIRLKDFGITRSGEREAIDSPTTAIAYLDSWAEDVTPLTMRSVFEPFDNKQVIIERAGLRPARLSSDIGREAEYATITMLEVS